MNHLEGVMVVGLTGQTGSGKTTACRKFMENGFAVINADEIARNIMKPDSVCLREVNDFFGTEILNEDKSLNRQGLADIVFNNPKKLEQLNSIMYPHITSEILERDHITPEQAQARMSAQHNEKFFVDNSDFIIRNNDGMSGLDEIVNEMSDKIKCYYSNKFKDLEFRAASCARRGYGPGGR